MQHSFSSTLLAWYDQNARDLPWRGFHDSYRTWISEIMLQQTRVDTVIPYYRRFLSLFPTLEDLASAPEEKVLKAWEGLGYYSRARNLQKGARQVMHEYRGRLPSDPAELVKISGIGPYTAGAIASIAYDCRVPAVDGNVIRVLSRVFGIREDMTVPAVRRGLSRLAADLVPADRPGDYNQAVMDLGATVCVPGTPDCDVCPMCTLCDACLRQDAADLPNLPQAHPPRIIGFQLLLLRSGRRLLMRRRTENLLNGLWVFPLLESEKQLTAETVMKKLHLSVSDPVYRSDARHVFTHQIWQMQVYSADAAADAEAPDGYAFVDMLEIRNLAVPSAMKHPLSAAMRLWPEYF